MTSDKPLLPVNKKDYEKGLETLLSVPEKNSMEKKSKDDVDKKSKIKEKIITAGIVVSIPSLLGGLLGSFMYVSSKHDKRFVYEAPVIEVNQNTLKANTEGFYTLEDYSDLEVKSGIHNRIGYSIFVRKYHRKRVKELNPGFNPTMPGRVYVPDLDKNGRIGEYGR